MCTDCQNRGWDYLHSAGGSGSVGSEYAGHTCPNSGFRYGRGTCTTYSNTLPPYYARLREGGAVVFWPESAEDKRWDWVLHGPMLNLDLPPDIEDPIGDLGFMGQVMILGMPNQYGQLALLKAAKPEWRGLDSVGLGVYLQGCREAGAIVGERRGAEIVWEDGLVSAIPPYEVFRRPEGSFFGRFDRD